MKREDFENPPTVVGKVVAAWIGRDGEPDVMHVQAIDEARDIATLLRGIGDDDNPDPTRPFTLIGSAGTFAKHGYSDEAHIIGKHCLIYADGRFERVAIESDQGDSWDLVIWAEFV